MTEVGMDELISKYIYRMMAYEGNPGIGAGDLVQSLGAGAQLTSYKLTL
jgi:hypothetical protein